AGAAGVLLDTADKAGPGLRGLIAPRDLASWVSAAHDAGLLVALAGKLTESDLSFARDAGADIAGVRGAACDGGGGGRGAGGRGGARRRVRSARRSCYFFLRVSGQFITTLMALGAADVEAVAAPPRSARAAIVSARPPETSGPPVPAWDITNRRPSAVTA